MVDSEYTLKAGLTRLADIEMRERGKRQPTSCLFFWPEHLSEEAIQEDLGQKFIYGSVKY